jgi:hypothetical protein
MGTPQNGYCLRGKDILADNSCPHRIADVMVDISDDIRNLANLTLKRIHRSPFLTQDICSALGVLQDAIPHLPGQIESLPIPLQEIHNPQALLVMPESLGVKTIEHIFAHMTEWCMTQIVAKGNGLCEVLVKV